MLQRRSHLEGSFSQQSDRSDFDPKQIAPTLAMKEAPLTEVLMKGPSRLKKKRQSKITDPNIGVKKNKRPQ